MLLAGPAPSAPPSPDRDYVGPGAIVGPAEAPITVGATETDERDGTASDGAAPPAPQPAPATAAPPPSAKGPTVDELARRRRVPRLLGSLEGEPDAEVAKHRKGRLTFYPGLQIRNQVNWVSPFTIDR
ncbi:MAG: hypothetical protein D6705_05620, partial [Deltaproteobacteria bacterium]